MQHGNRKWQDKTIACPRCRGFDIQRSKSNNTLTCPTCGHQWQKRRGVYGGIRNAQLYP